MQKYEEFKGFWFIPGKEDKPVPGILKFNPNDSIRLELIGDIAGDDGDPHGRHFLLKKREFPIIFGEVSDGQKITLIDCYRGKSSLNYSSKFPIVSYQANLILHGVHLESLEEEIFGRLETEVPLLLDWLNQYPTKQKIHSTKDDCQNGFEISYKGKSGLDISFQIEENLTLRFRPYSYSSATHQPEILIRQGYLAVFESNQLKSIGWYIKQIEKFLDFLNFATFRKAHLSKMIFFGPEAPKGSLNSSAQIPHSVMCYKVQEFPEGSNKKWGYLFSFKSVKKEFPDIIKKWFSFDIEMRPILYHLIKSIQTKKYFDSVDFLIVVQALEGYHSRFVDLKNISLKVRINDLIDSFKDISVIENSDIDIKAIVDTRHYYSHFFPYSKKDKIYDGIELYEETKKLKAILTCCVLRELGLSNEKINELLPMGSNPII